MIETAFVIRVSSENGRKCNEEEEKSKIIALRQKFLELGLEKHMDFDNEKTILRLFDLDKTALTIKFPEDRCSLDERNLCLGEIILVSRADKNELWHYFTHYSIRLDKLPMNSKLVYSESEEKEICSAVIREFVKKDNPVRDNNIINRRIKSYYLDKGYQEPVVSIFADKAKVRIEKGLQQFRAKQKNVALAIKSIIKNRFDLVTLEALFEKVITTYQKDFDGSWRMFRRQSQKSKDLLLKINLSKTSTSIPFNQIHQEKIDVMSAINFFLCQEAQKGEYHTFGGLRLWKRSHTRLYNAIKKTVPDKVKQIEKTYSYS